MRPTLAAEQVRDSLSQYLATTYALASEGRLVSRSSVARDALTVSWSGEPSRFLRPLGADRVWG
ncbi:hypothetical protein ACX6XY_03170 [Streptomyces sp. O3]